jgi:hypothetical protein
MLYGVHPGTGDIIHHIGIHGVRFTGIITMAIIRIIILIITVITGTAIIIVHHTTPTITTIVVPYR